MRIAEGRLAGYPARGGIGFVDVREVVEGLRLAMKRGRRGERYILSGENISYRDFVHRAARIAGVAPPRWAVPYWMLWGPACLATAAGWLRPSSFGDFNLVALRAAFCDHYVSAAKARQELGVTHWPIDTAIADTLAWFRTQGYLAPRP